MIRNYTVFIVLCFGNYNCQKNKKHYLQIDIYKVFCIKVQGEMRKLESKIALI